MVGRVGISVAILVGVMLCRGSDGQGYLGMDWLKDLHENINTLNKNIQQNVQQLNQRVQQNVQGSLAQVHRLTENLNSELASIPSTMQGANIVISGGNNVVLSDHDGTKIVHSGRTSDGKPYVRESTDKIVGDTLRHLEKIYDPTTNTSKVHGYTLDLKDPNAKPVPINDTA